MDLDTPSDNWWAVVNAFLAVDDFWNIQEAATELSDGSIKVRTFDVLGSYPVVGAEFDLDYVSGVGDPTNDATYDMHWIQVVTDNHNISDNPGHGNSENIVDVDIGQLNPYYDDGGLAADTYFYDFSRREGDNDHSWYAELFLVTTPDGSGFDPTTITVWSGVGWGWANSYVPVPPSLWLFGAGLASLAGVARRRRARG